MKWEYTVPVRWGRCLWLVGVIFSGIFPAILYFGEFTVSPWLYASLSLVVVTGAVWIWHREFSHRLMLSMDHEVFLFVRVTGEKQIFSEPVTRVTEDQIQFHLYAESDQINLFKRGLPDRVLWALQERVVDAD